MTWLSRPDLNYLYIYMVTRIYLRYLYGQHFLRLLRLCYNSVLRSLCYDSTATTFLTTVPYLFSVCVVSRTSVFPRITSSLRSVSGKGLEALCSVRLDGSSVANFVRSCTGFEPDGHRRITFRNSELYDRIVATQA